MWFRLSWFLGLGLICLGHEAAYCAGVVWPTDALNREMRRDLATQWQASFATLDAQIPSLSPSQQAWLKTEYEDELRRGGMTTRAISAMKSLEFQIYIAKPRVQQIRRLLSNIATDDAHSQKTEVAIWTEVSYRLSDYSLWEAVEELSRRRVIRGDVNGFKSFLFLNHAEWGRTILERITLPHFAGALPQ
jgi:hypothetical protein